MLEVLTPQRLVEGNVCSKFGTGTRKRDSTKTTTFPTCPRLLSTRPVNKPRTLVLPAALSTMFTLPSLLLRMTGTQCSINHPSFSLRCCCKSPNEASTSPSFHAHCQKVLRASRRRTYKCHVRSKRSSSQYYAASRQANIESTFRGCHPAQTKQRTVQSNLDRVQKWKAGTMSVAANTR